MLFRMRGKRGKKRKEGRRGPQGFNLKMKGHKSGEGKLAGAET